MFFISKGKQAGRFLKRGISHTRGGVCETNEKDTLERREENIRGLNIMDDEFFHKIMEDTDAIEELLQIMMEDSGIHIVSSQPQKFLRNCGSRSVILDVLCKGSDGRYFCIEMQKGDADDHQRRVRYNSSNFDTLVTEKGTHFSELPEVYSVYLMDSDLFHADCTAYRVNRIVEANGEKADNGFHELYVNAAVDDGSLRAGLMQYMKKTVGEDSRFPKITKRVKYFKEHQKGVKEMSKVFEEYANLRTKNAVMDLAGNLLRNHVSMEVVAASIPQLTREELETIYKECMQEEDCCTV